jgi:hypothetical protein
VWRVNISTGQLEGNIMKTIIAAHMTQNMEAVANQEPMCIHAMDMRQPPGIRMEPDIVRAKYNVIAAETAKTMMALICSALNCNPPRREPID